VVKFSGINP